jgi:hypothetical protein
VLHCIQQAHLFSSLSFAAIRGQKAGRKSARSLAWAQLAPNKKCESGGDIFALVRIRLEDGGKQLQCVFALKSELSFCSNGGNFSSGETAD